MRRYLALAAFIALVLGGGTLIGLTVQPDGWYAALNKPSFNPPNWVFAPVWSTLYVMIGVAGWLVWQRDWRSRMMAAWVGQLALNFIWTPVFFGLHAPAAALADHRGAADRHHCLHRAGLEPRPGRGAAVRALCGLGRLREPAQRSDRLP